MTTVSQLIQMLEEMPMDATVRVAHQPTYPMQIDIEQYLAMRSDRKGRKSVYLLDAGQVYDQPYAPAGIFEGQLEDDPDDLACESCGELADQEMAEIERYGDRLVVHATCMAPGDVVA